MLLSKKKPQGNMIFGLSQRDICKQKGFPPSVRLHNSFAVVFLELRLLGFGEQLHESAMSSKGTSPPQSGSHTIQAAVGRGSSQQDDGTRN